jgi:hypothetical protein
VVGPAEPIRDALERIGAGQLVRIVAVVPAADGLDPAAGLPDAALVLAPWPSGLEWLGRAPRTSPLGGRLPVLLLGAEPPSARLVVETPGPQLGAALAPAAAGPLAGLAEALGDLRRENQELKEALEARKAIERAKGILMEQERISEGEAFTRIQRLSMTKRKTMKEIAEAIILSREVTGKGG